MVQDFYDPEVEALTIELRKLVGYGATRQKVLQLPAVMALPQVRNQAPPDASESLVATVALAVIRNAVATLSDQEATVPDFPRPLPGDLVQQALHWLLALSQEARGMKATNRRQRAMRLLNVAFTVEHWRRPEGPETALLRVLARALVSRGRRQESADHVVERAEHTVFLNARGIIVRQDISRTIRALRNGLSQLKGSWLYPSDPRMGVLRFVPLMNCEEIDISEDSLEVGRLHATIGFPELRNGDTYTYAYRIEVESEVPAHTHFHFYPSVDFELLIVQLRFDRFLLPEAVWVFRDVSRLAAAREPPPDALLPFSPTGMYRWTIGKAVRNRYHGLAWAWSNE